MTSRRRAFGFVSEKHVAEGTAWAQTITNYYEAGMEDISRGDCSRAANKLALVWEALGATEAHDESTDRRMTCTLRAARNMAYRLRGAVVECIGRCEERR